MLTPAATVAVRMLEALGITTAEQAREALILWCRPSPRLAPADVRDILAVFNHNHDADDTRVPETPGVTVVKTPSGPIGYAISGDTPGGEQ